MTNIAEIGVHVLAESPLRSVYKIGSSMTVGAIFGHLVSPKLNVFHAVK
jgi:hypothetical protein